MNDGIAAAIVFFLAVLLFVLPLFSRSSGDTKPVLQIYQNGILQNEVPLDTDSCFTVSGAYENTITIHDGTVSVTDSTCPGKNCVHSDSISRPGQSIFCLPNQLELRISGSGQLDGIVQ